MASITGDKSAGHSDAVHHRPSPHGRCPEEASHLITKDSASLSRISRCCGSASGSGSAWYWSAGSGSRRANFFASYADLRSTIAFIETNDLLDFNNQNRNLNMIRYRITVLCVGDSFGTKCKDDLTDWLLAEALGKYDPPKK